jgi:hypothetical protein
MVSGHQGSQHRIQGIISAAVHWLKSNKKAVKIQGEDLHSHPGIGGILETIFSERIDTKQMYLMLAYSLLPTTSDKCRKEHRQKPPVAYSAPA